MRKGHVPAAREFLWKRVGRLSRAYALTSGTQTLATLRRERLFGTLSSAETEGRRWTLKRVGFLRPRITVRAEGSEVDEASIQPRWGGGGELVFAGGRRFTWSKVSFWRQEWIFADARGVELVRFRRGMTMSKARVTRAAAAAVPDHDAAIAAG